MSILSKLFGVQNPENQKNTKFRKIEKQYAGVQEMIGFTKASWLNSRGNHYGHQGNLNQAILDFKEAIELKPDYIPAYLSLSVAYRESRLFDKALEVLNRAPRRMLIFGKEVAGDDFDLYNCIGAVYLLMGDKLNAIYYVKKALGAINDPKRKEQLEFAKRAGVISEKEEDDAQMIEMLKDLIEELESK